MEEKVKDPYKSSRIFYIIEAALEYFISIAVGTYYLALIASKSEYPITLREF